MRTLIKHDATDGLRFRRNRFSWIAAIMLSGAVLIATGWYLVDQHWPFRYRNVRPLLEQVFASRIEVAHYHRVYFPHPGFVADHLTLRRNSAPDLPPIGSVRNFSVRGSWLDLLLVRRHVLLVDVGGLHVSIPAQGSKAMQEEFPPGSSADFSGPTTAISDLDVHDAVLDIMRTDGSRFSFPIRRLTFHNVQAGQPVEYSVDMESAVPKGHIFATGSFGPLVTDKLGATRATGRFTFSGVNLSDVGEIHGTLSSSGRFSGTLAALYAEAISEVPDFAVSDGRPTNIAGKVRCTINALNGDVFLHDIEVRKSSTVVQAQGQVAGSSKITDIAFAVTRGRTEDILHPFLRGEPPISGLVWLKGHAHLEPSGNGAGFLQRLSVDGRFAVPAERLTDKKSEKTLTAFSWRAQGDKPIKGDPLSIEPPTSRATDAVSSIEGPVRIRNGIATSDRLSFEIPGAAASLKGWYGLHDDKVNLRGDLRMHADISHASTGFKSLLLKPLAPFFRRRNAGAVIPICVTGAPGHYKVAQDLLR